MLTPVPKSSVIPVKVFDETTRTLKVSLLPQFYVDDPTLPCTRCHTTMENHNVLSHFFEGVTENGEPFHGQPIENRDFSIKKNLMSTVLS